MSSICKTVYEVIGDGLTISQAHFDECKRVQSEHWAFVEQVGGKGYRPSASRGLRSVFFKEVPDGWRCIGSHWGYLEAVPYKNNKGGKALASQIDALPQAPTDDYLARQLGYNPSELAIDRTKGIIYFCWAVDVSHPTGRHFVGIPRHTEDGFTPDPMILQEISELEFNRVIDAHNAEAQRLQAGEAA